MATIYLWHAPDQSHIWVSARTDTPNATNARIACSANGAYTDKIVSAPITIDADGWFKAKVPGLAPGTQYQYRVEIGGTAQTGPTGTARTLPSGAASFSFVSASCAGVSSGGATGTNTGMSNHINFETARTHDPLFVLHTGDIHYRDIGTNDPALFRGAYEDVLRQTNQHQLYRERGIVYMWDDHDYGPNNSSGNSTSRQAALEAYRRYSPRGDLPEGDHPNANAAVYHSFVCGRVRVIVTDVRSDRVHYTSADTSLEVKFIFGQAQREWFYAELLAAKAAGQAILWANTKPWTGGTSGSDDGWPFYTHERREISNFFQTHDLFKRTFMVSGDMHAHAVCFGQQTNYATSPTMPGFPIFQAAPWDRNFNQTKGGPYDLLFPAATTGSTRIQQFGKINVTDTGGSTIGVQFIGYTSGNTEVISHSFTVTASAEGDSTPPPSVSGGFVAQPQSAGFIAQSQDATVTNPPGAITNLTAVAASATQINLAWTAASGAASQEVQQLSGSTWTTLATLSGTATSYQRTGLTASTSYTFRIRAVNASGATLSNQATATTQAGSTPTLPTPTISAVTALSTTALRVAFSTHGEYADYQVERNGTVVASGVTASPFDDAGLTAGTTYSYRVRGRVP